MPAHAACSPIVNRLSKATPPSPPPLACLPAPGRVRDRGRHLHGARAVHGGKLAGRRALRGAAERGARRALLPRHHQVGAALPPGARRGPSSGCVRWAPSALRPNGPDACCLARPHHSRQMGVLHRDIKPDNFLFSSRGCASTLLRGGGRPMRTGGGAVPRAPRQIIHPVDRAPHGPDPSPLSLPLANPATTPSSSWPTLG